MTAIPVVNDVNKVNSCIYPDCPAEDIQEIKFTLANLHNDIKIVSEDQKKMFNILIEQKGIIVNLENIEKTIADLKNNNKYDHDEIFNRLRNVEQEKIDKKDISILMVILTVLFAVLSFIFNYLRR